jgi:hypothetical protein
MAECTAYTAIEVSGAGSTDLNGTYVPYSTNEVGGETFTIFTKDGLDSYPRIIAEGTFGNNYRWAIRSSSSGGVPIYGSTNYQTTDPINCPSEASDWSVSGTAEEPTPTVTGVTGGGGQTAPTFGLPADVVALITSRFGTVANFLRLRNQGQV